MLSDAAAERLCVSIILIAVLIFGIQVGRTYYPRAVYDCPQVRFVEWKKMGRSSFEPVESVVQSRWDPEAQVCSAGELG